MLVHLGAPQGADFTELDLGYRVPAPIIDFANRLLPEAAPDVRPSRSVRETGEAPTIVMVADDLARTVQAIVDASKSTLENTPPELAADLIDRGIVMAGGGSLLRGLDKRIAEETGRSDANDGEWLVVQIERAADNGGIRSILLLPQAIAHHCHWRSTGLIVLGRERTPGIRSYSEHGEVIARDKLARIALGGLRAA